MPGTSWLGRQLSALLPRHIEAGAKGAEREQLKTAFPCGKPPFEPGRKSHIRSGPSKKIGAIGNGVAEKGRHRENKTRDQRGQHGSELDKLAAIGPQHRETNQRVADQDGIIDPIGKPVIWQVERAVQPMIDLLVDLEGVIQRKEYEPRSDQVPDPVALLPDRQ